jgi:hypothetical protein
MGPAPVDVVADPPPGSSDDSGSAVKSEKKLNGRVRRTSEWRGGEGVDRDRALERQLRWKNKSGRRGSQGSKTEPQSRRTSLKSSNYWTYRGNY